MAHWKRVCICGRIMAQCLCTAAIKTLETVSPCRHPSDELRRPGVKTVADKAKATGLIKP